MKTSYLANIGAPALLLGLVAVGCTPGGRPTSLSSIAPKGDRQAARRAADAQAAIKARDGGKAVAAAEEAVVLAPRSAAYRATLGQAYLIAGRFASAEASFGEAVALDPTPGQTGFNLALSQIALGKWDVARETLAGLRGVVPDADVGLATALAGDREGALVILEAAARTEGASAKVRQNLALTYALSGRWNDAQNVAAQDLPGDQILQRISDWSKFARPESSWDQVASLLGVTPVEDPGRPAALALAGSAPEAFAEADPAPVAPLLVATAAAPAALATAAAEPVAAPVAVALAPDVVAASPAAVQDFAARETAERAPLILAERAPVRVAVARNPAQPRSGGRWVVQLGAFSQPHALQAAWARLSSRVATMGAHAPARSTFLLAGSGTVHRLTVSGFSTRADATSLCMRIKTRGGACFVRPAAGEQPVRWAQAAPATLLAMR